MGKVIFLLGVLTMPVHAYWWHDFDNTLSLLDHRDKKVRKEHAQLHRDYPDLWKTCPWGQMIRMDEHAGYQATKSNQWLIRAIKNGGVR